jgi:hypothetical protein
VLTLPSALDISSPVFSYFALGLIDGLDIFYEPFLLCQFNAVYMSTLVVECPTRQLTLMDGWFKKEIRGYKTK